jgi:ubiquinone/menaquinone biosynthesis C-methylase UbiE
VTGPNSEQALRRYRRLAPTYDRLAPLTAGMRRRAVARLALQSGDTVIDVACGTGLTFPSLEDGIGPRGRLIGVDLSAEMLKRAAARVEERGWENVTLICSAVEDAKIPTQADAAVFILTHDVMRSPTALRNVVVHVRVGGRVVAVGPKRAPRWAWPINLVMRGIASRYVTTDEGFDRPWEHLAELVPGLETRSMMAGGAYLAWGSVTRSSADPGTT